MLALSLTISPAIANSPPSLELLEFLAEWQDESGTVIDPFSLPEDPAAPEPPDKSDDDEK